jgi:hypothetical protein
MQASNNSNKKASARITKAPINVSSSQASNSLAGGPSKVKKVIFTTSEDGYNRLITALRSKDPITPSVANLYKVMMESGK